MDFELEESHSDLRVLAAGLLDRIAEASAAAGGGPGGGAAQTPGGDGGAPYDVAAWKAMAQAGLLDACLPEDAGGAGLGAIGLAVLLREVGAHVAQVPAFATLALGALPVARHGTRSQRELLRPVADGELVLTAAVREPGNFAAPRTVARRSADGYLLDGIKIAVPYARQAAAILVPATVPGEGTGVFLVPPGAAGVSHHVHPTATAQPAARIGLAGVRVAQDALLGDRADGAAAADLDRLAVAGAAATVSGVLAGALKLTTAHVKTREQFGRPLAEFQAVTMQVADVYVAGRALDAAMWAGCWRLAAGDGPGAMAPDADEVLAVAAWHAAGPALRALYTCQHLHGGLGLDVTYPLHRYFAWGTDYAHLLGGEQARLDILGGLLAAAQPQQPPREQPPREQPPREQPPRGEPQWEGAQRERSQPGPAPAVRGA
jgi:alkylation response protein AidB-like acyl-CoA dehydrogenase